MTLPTSSSCVPRRLDWPKPATRQLYWRYNRARKTHASAASFEELKISSRAWLRLELDKFRRFLISTSTPNISRHHPLHKPKTNSINSDYQTPPTATPMPTHALLGATGSTGSAILRHLLTHPPSEPLNLKVFIRSKTKLLELFPALSDPSTHSPKLQIQITSAPLTDTAALTSCLRDAEIIYQCIATNDAAPGTRVARDAADAVIGALQTLREQNSDCKVPTLLLLRSVSLNPSFRPQTPWLQDAIVHFCLHSVYTDLAAAGERYVTAAAEGLFEYVFVDPGALHDSQGTEGTGFELSVGEAPKRGLVGYADLGAAFVAIAGRKGEFEGKGVGVDGTGTVRTEWGTLAWYNLRGVWGRVSGW